MYYGDMDRTLRGPFLLISNSISILYPGESESSEKSGGVIPSVTATL